ncbi:MAG: hypothetical protein Kow00107_06250 [Planctomycetota bacterium]
MKEQQCKIEGCAEPAHAKGYCRKHYAKMWRQKGKEREAAEAKGNPEQPGRRTSKAGSERRKALRYELSCAQRMYDAVVGVASRIKWKKRIRWLETELRGLESDVDDQF